MLFPGREWPIRGKRSPRGNARFQLARYRSKIPPDPDSRASESPRRPWPHDHSCSPGGRCGRGELLHDGCRDPRQLPACCKAGLPGAQVHRRPARRAGTGRTPARTHCALRLENCWRVFGEKAGGTRKSASRAPNALQAPSGSGAAQRSSPAAPARSHGQSAVEARLFNHQLGLEDALETLG